MTDSVQQCEKCSRKIMPSISNRCMYCGADLPEELHLSGEEKNRVFLEKMEVFKSNEENADHIVNTLRQDYGTTIKATKKQRRKAKSQAVSDAQAEIDELISAHQEKKGSENQF